MEAEQYRVLMVTFPGQGHINPSLQFAKRLIQHEAGIKITFLTADYALNRMVSTSTTPHPQGLTFMGFFFVGWEEGKKLGKSLDEMMEDIRRRGSEAVEEIIRSSAQKGQPFTRVIYANAIPWVGQVAHALEVPSTFLWIQPATLLDIYCYYFNGYGDTIRNNKNDLSWSIHLPGLPQLTTRDLPSSIVDSNSSTFLLPAFKEHLDFLDAQKNPKVLVNSFDELEYEALRAVQKLNFVPIGPLIPSAFLDGKYPLENSFGGDLIEKSEDCIKWLDSREKASVIYVSFGSYCELPKQQMEVIAKGLIESQRPFLWVIRGSENSSEKEEENKVVFREELEKQGKIVGWCSQVEVLSHPSLGCFVSHCGWNSSLESLVSGVPIVGFPLLADQMTNAKLIEDVWETGVRVRKNEEGIVEESEIQRCVEILMGGGEKGEEMRRNAQKWKKLAKEAAMEGGSSHLNLKAFVDQEIKGVVGISTDIERCGRI